jgi:hypothetical protein
LLYLTADHLAKNFTGSAKRLGIPQETFARVALRHPNLLVIRPERLEANANAVCEALAPA